MKKSAVLISTLFIAGASGIAVGDSFTDPASFYAAIEPGYLPLTLDNSGSGVFPSWNFSGGPYSFDITATGPGTNQLFNDPGIISTESAVDGILISFTSGNVTAVGGNIYASDNNFLPIVADVTFTLSDGTVESFTSSSTADFRGFTSAVAITSIFIDADDSLTDAWSTVDFLIVGSAIPTPGSLAMLGLGGLVATRRRR